MESKEWQKGTEIYLMMGDFFRLCKMVWDIQDGDEYWEYVAKAAEEFNRKYRMRFARRLTVALLEELKIRSEERRGKDELGG